MPLLPNLNTANVKNVAESIIMAQQEPALGRTIFFIGAGCSVSAGVPAVPEIARRMVAEIAGKFRTCAPNSSPAACYVSLLEKDRIAPCFREGYRYQSDVEVQDPDIEWHTVYDKCFEKHFRSPDDVRDLFGRVLGECDGTINWAHLCLGELAAQKYLSTVITTNFDQLVLTGMASAGLLPVVCDGLESLNRLSSNPSHQQLIELHGSRHTYRLRNRPSEVAYIAGQHSAISSIIGLFNTARTFVAVGYGGREDGVMDLLIQAATTYPDKNLYWVTYSNDITSLGEKVRTFMSHSINAAVVLGQDADSFFLQLCKEMGVGAPAAIREPLARYRSILANLRKSKFEEDDIKSEIGRAETLLATLEMCERDTLESATTQNATTTIRQLRLRGEYREAYLAATRLRSEAPEFQKDHDLLREIVITITDFGDELLSSDIAQAVSLYEEAVSLCEAMVAQDGGSKSVALYAETHRKAGAALIELGDFGAAKGHYTKALQLDREVAEAAPDDLLATAALASSYQAMGVALTRTGDLAGAIENLEASLKLRQEIANQPSADAVQLANLSMAYDHMGDARKEHGDLAGAREDYERALAVDERLAAEEPSNHFRQRYLGIAYLKLGDLLRDEKNLAGARERLLESSALFEKLLAESPKTPEYKRDMAIVQLKLGDVESSSNNFTEAEAHYNAALTMFRDLANANPRSANALRDVSSTLSRIGQLYADHGKLDAALQHLEETLKIDQELAQREVGYTHHKRDLGLTHIKLGSVRRLLKHFDAAREHLSMSLRISEEHAAINPASADAQRDLSVAIENLADLEEESGNSPTALTLYERSRVIAERLAKDHPENPGLAEDLQITLDRIAALRTKLNVRSDKGASP